jgi:hypothetical protein
MEDAEATVGNTLLARSPNSRSGGSPGELARLAVGAGGAQIPTSVTALSPEAAADARVLQVPVRYLFVQVEVKTPKDEKYLDLVLDWRLTLDYLDRWVHSMIQRLLRQVGPLELRVQAAGGPDVQPTRPSIEQAPGWQDNAAERRAAGAPADVDTPRALTLVGSAGLATSSPSMTVHHDTVRVSGPAAGGSCESGVQVLDNQGGCVAGRLVMVGMATRGRRVDVLSPGTPGQHGASYDAGLW